jgi:hypothetical protein
MELIIESDSGTVGGGISFQHLFIVLASASARDRVVIDSAL